MKTKIKNLSTGLFALVFGLTLVFASSAFKAVSKGDKRISYTFYYDGPDYTATEVTDESNWKYDADDNTCSDVNEQACTIRVSSAFVDNPTTAPTLKTSLNLTAAASAPSVNYINGSADGTMQISNEPHN
ncbi:hypothetical protein [Pedobacter aquatilis]|uniref:hypothetical protein n=1 Tax=Pedobacter aquatilis TaxID=351343 RepID=UPI0029316175|nr:hypothetical protein [Pedobacter aquatilis]